MDVDQEALGARLRQVREYLNLSQLYVAQQTGIPRSAISDIERGQRRVDSLELRKLARVYQYPVGYFLGDDQEQDNAVSALARAVTELTEQDRAQVLQFAQYLRFSADSENRRPSR